MACASLSVDVTSESVEVSRQVCGIADRAIADLAKCGLTPLRPVRIDVVKSLGNSRGNPLALFEAATGRVRILDPSLVSRQIAKGSAYTLLPLGDLYQSLVVHELAHALFEQHRPPGQKNRIAHEYVSYAMQFAALSDTSRNILLDRFPANRPVEIPELNLFVAEIAPIRFGTRVWRHFSMPENGCDFMRRILNGEPVLPSSNGY